MEKELNGDADSTHSSMREINDVAFTNGDAEPLVLADTHEPEAVYTSVLQTEERVVKDLVPVQRVFSENVIERVPVATRVVSPAPVYVNRVVSPAPRIVRPISTTHTVERVAPRPVYVERVVEKVAPKPVYVQKVVQPIRQRVVAAPTIQRVYTREAPVRRVVTAPVERVIRRSVPVERVVTRASPVERIVTAAQPVENYMTVMRSNPVERIGRSYTVTRSSTPRSRSLVYLSSERGGSARTIRSTYSTIPRYSELI